MTTICDRQAFMSAFTAATQPGPKDGVRVLNGAVAIQLEEETGTDLRLGANEVYLTDIHAFEMKRGHGTEAMTFLGSLASAHGVDIVLHAAGTADDSPSDYALIQFYKKHGFRKCGGGYNAMFRPANPDLV